MKNKYSCQMLRRAMLCHALLMPVMVFAEESTATSDSSTASSEQSKSHGKLNLGLGNVTMDEPGNHKFGEYSGIEDDDSHIILNFDVLWQEKSAYLEATGKNMGLDSRRSEVETGQYGNFSLKFQHQQIPHLESTNAATPFNGVGSDRLSLPAGFVRANETGNMTNLDSSLKGVSVRTDRKEDNITYTNYLGTSKNLKMELNFRNETKEGLLSLGGTIGQHPGFVDSAILPVPVNYKTKEISAKLSFTKKSTTYEVGYFLSKFTNENESVTWDIPFSQQNAFATPYPVTARTSLPVNNEQHKFNLNILSKFSQSLVFSALVEVGKMKQDEDFLPYSIDDASLVTTPLPRDSAEAEIDTTHINLNLTGRPSSALNWRGKFRHYKTDNKTPEDQFQRVTLDTVAQAGADSEKDNPNHAFDYEQNEISLDGTIRIGQAMAISAGYEIDKVERSHREVDETEDQTFRTKLRTKITRNIKGTVHYTHSQREGDGYDPYQAYNDTHTAQYISDFIAGGGDPNDTFLNHFNMRKYDVADRDRDIYGLQLDMAIGTAINFGVHYLNRTDEFDKDLLGINETENQTYGFDIDFIPSDSMSVYFNYTREELQTRQTGHTFNFDDPATPGPPTYDPGQQFSQASDPTRRWTADHEDEIDTFELGGWFKILEEKLILKTSYIYSRAENKIEFAHGSNTDAFADPAEDIDGLESERHTIRLSGEYKKTDNLGIELGLVYEKLDYQDWQKAGIQAGRTAIADVLPLTGELPDNEVYFIYTTVNYKW